MPFSALVEFRVAQDQHCPAAERDSSVCNLQSVDAVTGRHPLDPAGPFVPHINSSIISILCTSKAGRDGL